MATFVFDPAAFRVLFPQFADATTYPDARLNALFGMASAYIEASTPVCEFVPDVSWSYVMQLMTAHLVAISAVQATGGTPGIVNSSSVGDVSVTLAQAPYGTSPWRFWLSQTPYGQQLLALLDGLSVGGFYIGGLPERSAFRKVGGVF